MPSVTPFLIAGLTALVAMDYVPSITSEFLAPPALAASQSLPAGSAVAVKGDRLATAQSATRHRIVTVEVVGLNDAAVVYRDRDGSELFRTDPMSNTTVVSKSVQLPALTIRHHANSTVTPMAVEQPAGPSREPSGQARDNNPTSRAPAAPRKLPVGCEPSFSPVASPSMAHHSGRCMAALEPPFQVADLRG